MKTSTFQWNIFRTQDRTGQNGSPCSHISTTELDHIRIVARRRVPRIVNVTLLTVCTVKLTITFLCRVKLTVTCLRGFIPSVRQ